jgi:hypothetical protein
MSNIVVKPQRLSICVQLLIKLLGIRVLKKSWSEDVDVSVPKSCGYDESSTVDDDCRVRNFDRRAGTGKNNEAVAHNDRSVFDRDNYDA